MKYSRDTFPSAIEACFLVVALLVVELAVGAVMLQFRSVTGLEWQDLWGFITIVGNGVLFSVLMHFKQQRYGDLLHPSKNSVTATLGVVGLPVLMLVPGLVVLGSAMQYLLIALFPMSSSEERMFEFMTSGVGSILMVCIIGPALEEMLFRGVILRSFLNQYSRKFSIIASSVIFGVVHFNVYQFFIGLGIGLVLAWLYDRTRSLWPGILLHTAYNSTLMWIYATDTTASVSDTWLPSPASAVIMLAISVVGALLLRKVLTVCAART
jgi:hypothetical protein